MPTNQLNSDTTPDVWLRNVRVFDGISDRVTEPCHVLVRGGTIARVGDDILEAHPEAPSAGGSGATAQEFDGTGHVLMPGLIDAHYHLAFSTVAVAEILAADPG